MTYRKMFCNFQISIVTYNLWDNSEPTLDIVWFQKREKSRKPISILIDLKVERGIYFIKIIGQINDFGLIKQLVTFWLTCSPFFFQVPFFSTIICFFGSVGADEAVREIEYHCKIDWCRQLLGHFTPIAGADTTTKLV